KNPPKVFCGLPSSFHVRWLATVAGYSSDAAATLATPNRAPIRHASAPVAPGETPCIEIALGIYQARFLNAIAAPARPIDLAVPESTRSPAQFQYLVPFSFAQSAHVCFLTSSLSSLSSISIIERAIPSTLVVSCKHASSSRMACTSG